MTEFFEVRSGLWQGCILSLLLFLITIDWVMCQTTSDHSRGIQWTPFSHLEDLDFADDLAVISATYTHIKEKTNRLSRYAKQVSLHINKQKTQTMRINALVSDPVNIEGEPAEDVNDFTYLGSVISTDNRAQKDIKARIIKARGVFSRIRTIWKFKHLSLKTKIKLYNSNVK